MSASTSLHTDLALAYRTTRPLYRSHASIGTRPLGNPSRSRVEELIRLMDLDEQELSYYGDRDRLSWEIEDQGNGILEDILESDLSVAKAHAHYLAGRPFRHRFNNNDFHQVQIARPDAGADSWNDAEPDRIVGKIAAAAQFVRIEPAFDRYRQARDEYHYSVNPKHEALKNPQPVISHPLFLITTAANRHAEQDHGWQSRNAADNLTKLVRYHTGDIKIPGYKRSVTSLTLLNPIPASVADSLAGKRLADLIELPPVLDETEQAAWESLTILGASSRPAIKDAKGNPIGPGRTFISLEPAFPLMVDSEPGDDAPKWQAAWREVAALAHPL